MPLDLADQPAGVGDGRIELEFERGGAEIQARRRHAGRSPKAALQLERAVWAVQARDVQQAALDVRAVARGAHAAGPVVVVAEGAVLATVSQCPGAPGRAGELLQRDVAAVEPHVHQAARDVRVCVLNARQSFQGADQLFYASGTFRLTRQQQGKVQGVLGHAEPASVAAWVPVPVAPCPMWRYATSSNSRTCSSSGE